MPAAGDTVKATDQATYYCRATQLAAQSTTSSSNSMISFDAVDDVDNLGIHDPVTNNSRFVIGLKLGWWQVTGTVAWASGVAGVQYGARITRNGSAVLGSLMYNHGNATAQALSSQTFATVQATAVTDYVEMEAWQITGSNAFTSVSSGLRCAVTLFYLGS